MKPQYLLILILALILPASDQIIAPQPSSTEASAAAEVTIEKVAATEWDGAIYLKPDDPALATASGLRYILIEEGSGPTPQSGDLVKVHYSGTLADGTQFDSSYDREEPLAFTLDTGEVFPGWDEGVRLLKTGGKARLIIPPELGYGDRGSGRVIPPDATLYLEVELLSIHPNGPITPAEVFEGDYMITNSGLKYYDFEPGSGPTPQPGQMVSVHYTGWFEDESMFDSSRLREQPFSFEFEAGEVIAGWEEGLASMKVGGRRQLIVPPELAYGETGAGGGAIPPDTTLIFEVELLAIE